MSKVAGRTMHIVTRGVIRADVTSPSVDDATGSGIPGARSIGYEDSDHAIIPDAEQVNRDRSSFLREA